MKWIRDADNNLVNLAGLSFIGSCGGELQGRFIGSDDYCVLYRGDTAELGQRRDYLMRLMQEMQMNYYDVQ